jgi:hypothetical protein
MQSVSPVMTDEQIPLEVVVALDQPEYFPIIVLPITYQITGTGGEVEMLHNMAAAVRFRPSEEERAKLAAGGDLICIELVFGQSFTPVGFQVCMPDESPRI